MTTSSGTTYCHYSGDKVIYETDSNNNIVADYTWDNLGNPVTMTKGGTTYYYHMNGHGDVTSLTDSSGNIVAQYQYDAWVQKHFKDVHIKIWIPFVKAKTFYIG
jgi:uncharacterized protein RhaS with RHS repeats